MEGFALWGRVHRLPQYLRARFTTADVVIADNLETGHKEAVHPKARFYQGDIRDRAFLDGF
ncbi:MAG: hypothetical protein ACLRSY_02040 [Acutalibacter sp.]